MDKKEKEIQKFMKSLNLSREEAEQLYLDDLSDTPIPEVAEIEKKEKAEGKKRNYTKTEKSQNKGKNKVRKVDEDKKEILTRVKELLEKYPNEVDNITVKTETEINFNFKNENYTLKLTKHRKKGD